MIVHYKYYKIPTILFEQRVNWCRWKRALILARYPSPLDRLEKRVVQHDSRMKR